MDESLRQTIFETFSEVFETMFFTFLEPLSEPPAAEEVNSAGGFIEALITYSGGNTGSFHFYFPIGLAKNITLNFLGVDEDEVEESQMTDTAGETANMAIGSLLGKLDPEGKCSLAIPEAKELENFSPDSILADSGLCMFRTEFGILWVVGSHS